jgi:hypothetical protein
MKKIYENPTTDIISMSVSELMAASLGNGDNPNNIDLGQAGTTNATSGNLSRRSVWDDEVDDEF